MDARVAKPNCSFASLFLRLVGKKGLYPLEGWMQRGENLLQRSEPMPSGMIPPARRWLQSLGSLDAILAVLRHGLWVLKRGGRPAKPPKRATGKWLAPPVPELILTAAWIGHAEAKKRRRCMSAFVAEPLRALF